MQGQIRSECTNLLNKNDGVDLSRQEGRQLTTHSLRMLSRRFRYAARGTPEGLAPTDTWA